MKGPPMLESLMMVLEDPTSMWLVLSGAVIGLVILYMVMWSRDRKDDDLPCPASTPLLGNTVEVSNNLHRLLDWWWYNNREYGGKDGLTTWKFHVLGQPTFVTTCNPKNILRRSKFLTPHGCIIINHQSLIIIIIINHQSSPPTCSSSSHSFWRFFGDGIFSADGQSWYFQRKVKKRFLQLTSRQCLVVV